MTQAGTRDPLLQCLHLNTHLCATEHKLYGTKNDCTHMRLGQIMNNRYKEGQNLIVTSEVTGARVLCMIPVHAVWPTVWEDHSSHLSAESTYLPLLSPQLRKQLIPLPPTTLRERARVPLVFVPSSHTKHKSCFFILSFLTAPSFHLSSLLPPDSPPLPSLLGLSQISSLTSLFVVLRVFSSPLCSFPSLRSIFHCL